MVPDFETLAKMLAGGRIDVALTAKSGNPELLKTAKSLPLVLGSSKFHHVLNKKNEALSARFDAVLKAMKADGRYEKLLKK